MPDETDQNLEQEVSQIDGEQQEEQQEEVKEEPETREGLISKIKNIIKSKADDDTGDDVSTDADDGIADDIPQEFTDAALAADWTEEAIKEFAGQGKEGKPYTDDELREQIPQLTPSSADSDKSEQPAQKEDEKEDDKESKDDEKDEVIKQLRADVDMLKKGQQKNIENDAEAKLVSQASRANQILDEASKEFDVFGTFETLPRFPDGRIISSSPQAKARNEVWYLAEDLEKTGMDFETALSTSLNAFKGKNLVKDAKRNLVKDLKKSEKRLSAKHSSHEQVKPDLSGPDLIREVGKKHGVEIL